jgi:plasmid stability protein
MAEDQNRTLQDKFMLRFPDGMRDRIKEAAAENGRSMNAEIVYRLQTTLEMDDYVPGPNVQTDETALELARALVQRLEQERGG